MSVWCCRQRARGVWISGNARFISSKPVNVCLISVQLLESARFIEGSLQYRPDYFYYSENICGENYYCIGDAAAFVDPIFSHGVQNALYNAAVATLAIKASLQNPGQRQRYSHLCASRMQQFYGFSRALSLGDSGCFRNDQPFWKFPATRA